MRGPGRHAAPAGRDAGQPSRPLRCGAPPSGLPATRLSRPGTVPRADAVNPAPAIPAGPARAPGASRAARQCEAPPYGPGHPTLTAEHHAPCRHRQPRPGHPGRACPSTRREPGSTPVRGTALRTRPPDSHGRTPCPVQTPSSPPRPSQQGALKHPARAGQQGGPSAVRRPRAPASGGAPGGLTRRQGQLPLTPGPPAGRGVLPRPPDGTLRLTSRRARTAPPCGHAGRRCSGRSPTR